MFNYIETNPAENINVTNKVMVDVEETEDVYLAIEKGLKLISILQVSYGTLIYYSPHLEHSEGLHVGHNVFKKGKIWV